MKFIVERTDALAAMGRVAPIVPPKADIQLMEHVRVEARSGGTVEFRTCNLDVEMAAEITGAVQEPGVTTIHAKRFHEILKGFAEGSQVAFTLEPGVVRAQVKAGRSRFGLDVLRADGFPTLGSPSWDAHFAYAADVLHRTFVGVAPAISREATRYYLNGMHIHIAEDGLRFVATDGHRLHLRTLPSELVDLPRFTIPSNTVKLMADMLAEAKKAEALITISAGKVGLTTPDGTLLSKVLASEAYPDYRRVIPADNGNTMRVGSDALAASVRRVMGITDDKSRSIKVSIGQDAIKLSGRGTGGEGDDEVEGEISSPEMAIGFNGRFILDTIASLGGETVEVGMAEPGDPTIWRNPDDAGGLCVLMPLRV